MARLFGTNGIRGVFGDDFNLDFIHDITLAISAYFDTGPILVGYDGRKTSPLIAKVICSALNYSGLDCRLAGLVPTPALEFAVKQLKYNGGIMITASHNPPQYNGIKPVGRNGVEISREDELIIEDIYFEKKWKKFDSTCSTKTEKESRVLQTYFDGIKNHINLNNIKSKNYKIVLDLGNGAQAVSAPKLAKELGCTIHAINETIDGDFPGRGSEPTPENLSVLSDTIKENNADLGIAFDGDGDRSLLCDENGTILTGDKSALLLSKFLLEKNPNSKVITCLNSGSAAELIAQQFSSDVIRTKVGSVEVSQRMLSENALIGFEENGGFMFGPHNQVRDGCMTMALALDLIASYGKSISSKVSELPSSFTTKDKISCTKEQIQKIMKTLKDENPDADTADGIKITFDEKNWVMVRPSGTEPIVRIYAESDSQNNLEKLMSQQTSKIQSIIHTIE
jgi:phosphomannomutase/phosphoglucomutase